MEQNECISIIFYICLYTLFAIPSKGDTMDTAKQSFGICSKSFLKNPSITLTYKAEPKFICIPQEKNIETDLKCGNEQEQMCIAVFYLPDYQIPLFSGFHIRGDPSGLENPVETQNIRGSDLWVISALNRDGLSTESSVDFSSWKTDNTRTGITRGHLTPAAIAALINTEMSMASFTMFNVAPQYGSQNAIAGAKLEKNLKLFAEHCKLTLEYPKAPKLLNLPPEKKWQKGEFTFDKLKVRADFYLVTGTIPDEINRRWVNKDGIYIRQAVNNPEKQGSHIPFVFWAAACCLYQFDDIGTIPLTFGYYVVNEPEAEKQPNNPDRKYKFQHNLSKLKESLNDKSKLSFAKNKPETIVINNFFGVDSQCEEERTYVEIADVLNRYTKGVDARGNLEVMKLMYSMPSIFPESSFPSKPKPYRWTVSK